MKGKMILRGSNARDLIAKGIEIAADTVGATLGPRGRTVVISQSFGDPKTTKDGVTVAKAIKLDGILDIGAQMLRTAAGKSNDSAGDGTTTTTVLAREIALRGIQAVTAGMNPQDIKRGIDKATKEVLKSLEEMSKKIKSSDEVEHVATVSANAKLSCEQI